MKKLACLSDTTALPTRSPLQPAASIRRPALSPSGLVNTDPAFCPAGLVVAAPAHDLGELRLGTIAVAFVQHEFGLYDQVAGVRSTNADNRARASAAIHASSSAARSTTRTSTATPPCRTRGLRRSCARRPRPSRAHHGPLEPCEPGGDGSPGDDGSGAAAPATTFVPSIVILSKAARAAPRGVEPGIGRRAGSSPCRQRTPRPPWTRPSARAPGGRRRSPLRSTARPPRRRDTS